MMRREDGEGRSIDDAAFLTDIMPKLRSVAARELGRRTSRWVTPDDLVQQCLVESLEAQRDGAVRTARQFVGHAIRRIRWRAMDQAHHHRADKGWSAVPVGFDLPGSALTDKLDRRELAQDMERRIAALPEPDATIVREIVIHQQSYDDVAKLLGDISKEAVRKRYDRALLRMGIV